MAEEAPERQDSILRIFRQHRRSYVALNALYYGLVLAGMLYVFTQPELQVSLIEDLRKELTQTFPMVVEAYTSGNFPLAAVLTFGFNLLLGSLLYITAPSLLVPFGGLVTGCVRAVAWGLILAPTQRELALTMVPHSLTLILEGQGYILAMFASYVQWRAILNPKSVGEEKRLNAYSVGLKRTGRIYLLVAAALAIAAVYEAFEVIYLIPILVPR
jgi:hypothetical protein